MKQSLMQFIYQTKTQTPHHQLKHYQPMMNGYRGILSLIKNVVQTVDNVLTFACLEFTITRIKKSMWFIHRGVKITARLVHASVHTPLLSFRNTFMVEQSVGQQ